MGGFVDLVLVFESSPDFYLLWLRFALLFVEENFRRSGSIARKIKLFGEFSHLSFFYFLMATKFIEISEIAKSRLVNMNFERNVKFCHYFS